VSPVLLYLQQLLLMLLRTTAAEYQPRRDIGRCTVNVRTEVHGLRTVFDFSIVVRNQLFLLLFRWFRPGSLDALHPISSRFGPHNIKKSLETASSLSSTVVSCLLRGIFSAPCILTSACWSRDLEVSDTEIISLLRLLCFFFTRLLHI
jgi:hypothetical protein